MNLLSKDAEKTGSLEGSIKGRRLSPILNQAIVKINNSQNMLHSQMQTQAQKKVLGK